MGPREGPLIIVMQRAFYFTVISVGDYKIIWRTICLIFFLVSDGTLESIFSLTIISSDNDWWSDRRLSASHLASGLHLSTWWSTRALLFRVCMRTTSWEHVPGITDEMWEAWTSTHNSLVWKDAYIVKILYPSFSFIILSIDFIIFLYTREPPKLLQELWY